MKGILSNKDSIEATLRAAIPLKRMKLTQAHNPKIEEGVLTWLK